MKIALKGFLDAFGHAMCMNTADPMYETFKQGYGERVIGFTDSDPTTEVIARMVFAQVREGLARYARRRVKPCPARGAGCSVSGCGRRRPPGPNRASEGPGGLPLSHKKAPPVPGGLFRIEMKIRVLQLADVLRSRTLGAGHHVEADPVTFGQ